MSREGDANAPHAVTLRQFVGAERKPLIFHIEGLLPAEGKLTFSAPAKTHKTFFAEELGLCLAAGDCRWLGFRFGDPVRVLFVQPDLSDALLVARTNWILETAPGFLERERALENFIVMETAQGRPNLATDTGRARVERLIREHKPGVLICDPLYMLFPGLQENDADAMSLALDYLATLTIRYGVAIVLTHHFNKGGTAARGSSVFQGWGESDLTMTPLDSDRAVCRVDALLRSSFGDGFPAYWRRPTRDSAWFESMPEGCEAEGKGRPHKATVKHVTAALKAAGKTSRYSELSSEIMELGGCSKRNAEEAIREAKETGAVHSEKGIYGLAE